MAESYYLSSQLRRYSAAHQFGATTEELRKAILDIFHFAELHTEGGVQGTLASDVFNLFEPDMFMSTNDPDELDALNFTGQCINKYSMSPSSAVQECQTTANHSQSQEFDIVA